MKKIGSLLLFLGVGTIVLNLIGYEFAILGWIDNWGEDVGWGIRAAMIVAGGALFVLGQRAEAGSSQQAAEAPRQEPTFGNDAQDPGEQTFGTAIPDPGEQTFGTAIPDPAEPAPAGNPARPPQEC